MVHIREVVREIMKKVVMEDYAEDPASTLYKTLRIKQNPLAMIALQVSK